MAKNVTLTVKVDDVQFQQFMKDFNAFSANIKNLTGQFNQLNSTIKKANLAAQALQATFDVTAKVTKSILSTVGGITKHLIRWSTIVGAVTTLLGIGGGLFGIERLASSIMQRRRQMLGLGGDWGRTRASNIYSQSVLGDPGSVLQNIRMGTAGSQEQMSPLLALGVPFGTKKGPEDILTEILPKVHQILKSAGPNLALSVAQGYGLDKIFTDPMDLIRLSTEEGYKEIQKRQERIAQESKALELSKQAQDGWSDFHLQLLKAGAAIENIFGEKLAKLAAPLSDLSRAFVEIVRKFMDMPAVGKAIQDLAKWMTELAEGLTEDKLKDKFHEFNETLENSWIPFLRGFKDDLVALGEAIKAAVKFIKGVNRAFTPPGWLGDRLNNMWGPSSNDDFLKDANKGLANKYLDPGTGSIGDPMGVGPTPAPAPAPGKQSFFGGIGGVTNRLASFAGNAFGGSSLANRLTSFGGANFGGANTRIAAMGGGNTASLVGSSIGGSNVRLASTGGTSTTSVGGTNFGGNGAFAAMSGGNRRFASLGGGAFGGDAFSNRFNRSTNLRGGNNVRLASWSAAANRASPRGGDVSIGGSTNSLSMAMLGRGRQGGPLSSDNWQSSRTASLTIRQVPGSNVFMSGAGMAV